MSQADILYVKKKTEQMQIWCDTCVMLIYRVILNDCNFFS
jgi:hypothetical protein